MIIRSTSHNERIPYLCTNNRTDRTL